MTKFGILSKFDVLQTIPSIIISKINPAIFHNIGKYNIDLVLGIINGAIVFDVVLS